MKSLDYLDSERLKLLPESYWLAHEFCFYLHDAIARMMTEYEISGIHNIVADSLEEAIQSLNAEDKFQDIELLSFLKNNDETYAFYKKHILSQTIIAMTSDMLHFLYEALSCFEKRKFSVGFSLLRKPFKEHLLFMCWILSNEDDFIRRFEQDNFKSFKLNTQDEKKGIILNAIDQLHTKEAFDGELIFELIFSKTLEKGFEPTWQRATHLTTSMGSLLKTEDLSFNFIFENPNEDYYFEFLEDSLPYLMFFMLQVCLACFDKIYLTNDKTVNHLIYTSLGVFECLNFYKDSSTVMNSIQENFDNFLKCMYCNQHLTLNKESFAKLLISETFECKECGLTNDFPFHWLLAQTKISFLNRKDI